MGHPNRGLKTIAVFGFVILLLVVILPIGGIIYTRGEFTRYAVCQNKSELDEECKPGILWSTFVRFDLANGLEPEDYEEHGFGSDSDNKNEIVEATPSLISRAIGESCGDTIGYCKIGEICLHDDEVAIDVCSVSDQESPLVLSLNLDGMSLDKGKYVAEVGQEVVVRVQAMNADSVKISLKGIESELDRGQGGQFTGSFILPASLDGELLVLANKEFEIAAMTVKVVSF